MPAVALSTPRRDYLGTPLLEDGAGEDPLALFLAWFQAAESTEADATAMALATVGPHGQPSARLVLLKDVDVRGFTFYTNYESRKASELAVNNLASLLFYWRSLDRQVRVEGQVDAIPAAESDEYFQSRPVESRWSAYASPQSRPIASREDLEVLVDEVREHFGDAVPRPLSWGGYRLSPHAFEFWQGRPNRLHDRLSYERHGGSWRRQRLAP
jgi:pyridoxamine 5'-phosphate oxidase